MAFDETGFLKKGTASAGVARQYSGTAGWVENCQIGVFLSYASPAGCTFLDREPYLSKAWIDDQARCKCALNAGLEAEWTTGDAEYGQHSGLHRLEAPGMRYVMAVPMM